MLYCQQCHTSLKADILTLEWNYNDKSKPYSRENEILKLQRKYDLSTDYLEFLIEEYPDSSIKNLDEVIRDVWKETKPEQVKDDILLVTCWNCQTELSSELNICPKCEIELLSEINYSQKVGSVHREKNPLNEQSVPKGLVIVSILTGLDGLTGILLGYFFLQDLLTIFLSMFEIALVIGLLIGSRFSYIAIIIINVLTIIGALMIAVTSYSASYYYGAIMVMSAILSILLSVGVIFLLSINAKYFSNDVIPSTELNNENFYHEH